MASGTLPTACERAAARPLGRSETTCRDVCACLSALPPRPCVRAGAGNLFLGAQCPHLETSTCALRRADAAETEQ